MGVNIEEKVIEVLTNHSNIEEINQDMYLDEIGIDSLAYVEACMDLEDELKVESDFNVLDYDNIKKSFGMTSPSPQVSDVIRTVKEVYEKSQKEYSH